MNAYRIITNTKLFAFNDHIETVPILRTTLKEYQNDILNSLGIRLIDIEIGSELEIVDQQYFLFHDDLVFTKAFVIQAIKFITTKSDVSRFNVQFGIESQESAIRFSLPTNDQNQNDFVFDFWYINSYNREHITIKLSGTEYDLHTDLPKQIVEDGKYSMNQNEVFAAQIISPFHLLQANMALNLNRMIPLQKLIPKLLRPILSKPFSRFAIEGLKFISKKGKNCRIHPTAIVEGCILGDNVTIGAYAVCRLSIIGNNVNIGDLAVVNYSVVGDSNFVNTGNQLIFCMTYNHVFTIHGPYQFSIFGESSSVFATINCDIRLDGKRIKIESKHGVIDSNQHLLGIVYGHHTKVGGSNIIAAGRIVPNHTVLNPPDFIHLKFPQNNE